MDELRLQAAARLRESVPGVRVEFNERTGLPHYVGAPDKLLCGPGGSGGGIEADAAARVAPGDDHRALKGFLEEHRPLYGFGAEVLANQEPRRRQQTAHNGLRTTVWQQRLQEIDVFEAVLIANTTDREELATISSGFLPPPALVKEAEAGRIIRVSAAQAISAAAQNLGEQIGEIEALSEPGAADREQRFRVAGLNGTTEARLVWLPMNAARVRLSWAIRLTSPARAETFLVLVDAISGEVLVRRRLTVYLTEASYRVFTSDSPTPFSPALTDPSASQPPRVDRVLVSLAALDTNASPAGWLPAGVNETRGNNVDAYLDRNGDNLPDLPRTTGAGRVFDFPLDLDDPPAAYGPASVTHLFYWGNWMHDRLYQLGFTEAAGNFQQNNFGRGGVENDPMRIEAQDGFGVNNANYTPAPDGVPGRIQMFVFTGPDPHRDGGLDTEIFLHEYTHGLTDRMVGGGVGISSLQTAGMGEGWSDFYALALLSEGGDDLDGNYAAAAYASHQLFGLEENYYFGIRRYPYSTDMSRNPLTLRDIDPTQADAPEDVPISPLDRPFSPLNAAQVHNQGEVWCVTLWDARASLIRKHGFDLGQQLILQLVTDGLRLGPPNPTFLQARDAIIQADLINNGGANYRELWVAFAKRGMGAFATVPPSSSTIGVVESFDEPDDLLVIPLIELVATGPVDGPFAPSLFTVMITNVGADSFTWSLTSSAAWLHTSPATGQLGPAGAQGLAVRIDAAARVLGPGVYNTDLVFVNHDSGVEQRRSVRLRIAQPERWTELFDQGDNDLAHVSLTFTPDGSPSFYDVCRQPASYFHVDPEGGQTLALDDDSFLSVTLSGANRVGLYGHRTNRFFVGSNGYITFQEGDTSLSESIPSHFNRSRISLLFDDLNPAVGGRVTWKQLNDRATITFIAVPEFGTLNQNSFQAELFYDGVIRLTWLAIAATDGLVGLSAGQGVPAGFLETDFSRVEACGPPLVLVLPTEFNEGDGLVPGRIELREPAPAGFTLNFESSDPTVVRTPSSIAIAKGATNIHFDLEIVDDDLLDGTQRAVLEFSAFGYRPTRVSVVVHDNEANSLSFNFPASTREGAGVVQGTLIATAPPAADVIVFLSVDAPQELAAPARALLRAGATIAAVELGVVDDNRFDGDQGVTLTASVEGWSGAQATLTVQDNEEPILRVEAPTSIHEFGGIFTNAGRVVLPGTLDSNLTVNLATSDLTELTLIPTVTIVAGNLAATFDVVAVHDSEVDGVQTCLITAQAPGWTGAEVLVQVNDNDTPPPPINPDPPHLATDVLSTVALAWTAGALIDSGGLGSGSPETNTYSVYLGTQPELGAADLLGATSATRWTPDRLQPLTTYYWQVLAHRPLATTPGPVWQFTTRGVDRYQWAPLAVEPTLGEPFVASVSAVNSTGDVVSNFTGSVTLEAFEYFPAETVQVLTFTRYADIRPGGTYQNTLGAVTSHFTHFQESPFTAIDPTALAQALEGRHVFLIVEQFASAEVLSDLGRSWAQVLNGFVQRGGLVIACSFFGDEHEILAHSGLLHAAKIDEYFFVDLMKRGTHPLTQGVPTMFEAEAASFTSSNGTAVLETRIEREPVVLARDIGLGHAVLIGTDFLFTGSALDRVVANAVAWAREPGTPAPIALTPTQSDPFNLGRLSQELTILTPGNAVRLLAIDNEGRSGFSTPFPVPARDDLSVSAAVTPLVAMFGSPVVYTLLVTNTGPGEATAVSLTNINSSGSARVVSVSQGACSNAGDRVICSLGPLAGGASARVVLDLTPAASGYILTNWTEIGRGEADGFADNNAVQTLTQVSPPVVMMSEPVLFEGDAGTTNAVFELRLASPLAGTGSVEYATSPGTAFAPQDYISSSGRVVFPPGFTTQYVVVQVVGDLLVEADEFFEMRLTNSVNLKLDVTQGRARIRNDDSPETVSLPFVEDWESGTFRPMWRVGGTAGGRAQVVSSSGPRGGMYHLTLDSAGGLARNEVTLALNLAGYSGVKLRFFARNLGDEPHAPPPGPFGGADFDGVAVSTNGSQWYEARSLRDLSSGDQELIVRLDDVLAERGLRFSSPFYIRFNQFDDLGIPFDGLAIDDIAITGYPPGLVPAGAQLVAEDCSPPNGAIDPGETVTLALAVRNTGADPAANVVGRLLPGAGVAGPSDGAPFGVVVPQATVTNLFTFTAVGNCDEPVTLRLELTDAGDPRGIIEYDLRLGADRVALREDFDNVPTGETLPGWRHESSVGLPGWWVVATAAHSPPHSIYAPAWSFSSDLRLTTPSLVVQRAEARLSFRHSYNTEACCDFGSLQISIDQGPFINIIQAGGRFLEGGYSGFSGWSGDSGGFIATAVDLPPTAINRPIQFRWRMSTDSSVGGNGWYIDSILLSDGRECCQPNDLALSAELTPSGPVRPGESASYRLRIANSGPTTATGVVLSHEFGITASAAPSQGWSEPFLGGIISHLGDIPGRGHAFVYYTVTPSVADMVYTNRAVVIRAEPDRDLSNNQTDVVIVTAPPEILIPQATIIEGNTGVSVAPVQVHLSAPSRLPVTADYETRGSTAFAPGDFETVRGVIVIPPGRTNTTLHMRVAGDTVVEDDEIFLVQVTNAGRITSNFSYPIRILDDDAWQTAAMPFSENWESGGFRPFWRVSGSAGGRAEVTSQHGPAEGAYHLLLHSDVFAVNEVTLRIDMSGHTNAFLRFWANNFNDEPHPPPAPSFIGRANFDGVAISIDGNNWHEAAGLRNRGSNGTVLIDLDAEVRRYGLAYPDVFYIRFNQYDDQTVPGDGIAIDDILLTASRGGTLAHLNWETLPPAVYAGHPFPVTLAARDAFLQVVPEFNGPLTLEALGLKINDPYLIEDFEDGDFDGWDVGGGSYTREVTTETAASGSYSFTLTGGTLRGHNGVSHLLPNVRPRRVDFSVRARTTNLSGGQVALGTGTNVNETATLFSLRPDGFMSVVDQGGLSHATPFQYDRDRWYRIGLALNWTTRTIDFFVDGLLVEAGISFRSSSVPHLSRIYLYNFHNMQAWWDDIQVLGAVEQLPVTIFPTQAGPLVDGAWHGEMIIQESVSEVRLTATGPGGITGTSGPIAIFSAPLITSVALHQGLLELRWEIIPGWSYRVESTAQPGGPWEDESAPAVEGVWSGAAKAGGPWFYRVVSTPLVTP